VAIAIGDGFGKGSTHPPNASPDVYGLSDAEMVGTMNEQRPPYVVQGSAAPIFKSREPCELNLRCHNCGGLLIEGYFAECFIDVGIKCFGCREITQTPSLEDGEILPIPIVTLGDKGAYLIAKTVEYYSSVAMTTDQQIAISNEACSPKKVSEPFEISEESLAALNRRFEAVSGVASDKRSAELKRYHAFGQSGSRQMPFDWATWKIIQSLKERVIDIDDVETNVALGRIYLFRVVDKMWSHHPRFEAIASEFSNSNAFFHTIGQFVLVGYFYEGGNRVGFSVRDVFGEAKPDLYTRSGANSKFYFEFKTPSSLIWERNLDLSPPAIRKNIRSILKTSSQLNKSRPGIFVLMANHPAPDAHVHLRNEVRSFLSHKGYDKPYVAGVTTMHCGGVRRDQDRKELRIGMTFDFESIVNQFCKLPNNPIGEKMSALGV
jgi:phage FluMu protein Com